jgi:D-tyrosyl-tRNA(Tyr) deacylase
LHCCKESGKRVILALIGVENGDASGQAIRLAERIVSYRMFPDDQDRMNLNVEQAGGGVLLVPQFTLAANTDKGNRASFASAAHPELGQELFEEVVRAVENRGLPTATGEFGANMQVELTNDGPVTFWLRVRPERVRK